MQHHWRRLSAAGMNASVVRRATRVDLEEEVSRCHAVAATTAGSYTQKRRHIYPNYFSWATRKKLSLTPHFLLVLNIESRTFVHYSHLSFATIKVTVFINSIFNIIKKCWQCKAGRERLTPYQSEDPIPTIPTNRLKEGIGKSVRDKKEASRKCRHCPALETRHSHTIEYGVTKIVPLRKWQGNKSPAAL